MMLKIPSLSGNICSFPNGSLQNSTGASLCKPHQQILREVLDNGLVVIVQENRAIPAISISGLVKAGGMYDSDGQAGCADFAAHMLTRGTKKRTWQRIAEETEAVGASISIDGRVESIRFRARSLAKDFGLILDILSDVLRHPSFPTEEIHKHRNRMLSLFKAWDDNPSQVGDRELRASIYTPGHPYHRRLQGYEETISKFGRYNLLKFHSEYYRPDATILVLVGDIDASEAIAKIEELFGDWKIEGKPADFVIPPVEMQEASSKVVSMMDKSQAEIFLGHKGISRTNPDFYAVDVMNRILGGSAGIGRLFNYVRDVQGLAYGVWSSFSAGLGEGPFIARAGVNPQNVRRAIQSILAEISRLKNEGVTEQELADAKEMIIGNFALSMETSGGIANALLNAEIYGLGLDYLQKQEQIYRAITKEQAEQAAEKYLHPEKCSLVIAGPYAE